MTQRAKLPVQTIARWPCFVAEAQPIVSHGKLIDQLAHRIRSVGDLAIIADFSVPLAIGQTNGNLGLADIQTNVNCCIILHSSSPMSEALAGPPTNPRSDIFRDGPPPPSRTWGLTAPVICAEGLEAGDPGAGFRH